MQRQDALQRYLDQITDDELRDEAHGLQNEISEIRLRYSMASSDNAPPKPDHRRSYPTPGPFTQEAQHQLRQIRLMDSELYGYILDIEHEAATLRQAHQVLEPSAAHKGDVETLLRQEQKLHDLKSRPPPYRFVNDRDYSEEELEDTDDWQVSEMELDIALADGMRTGRTAAYRSEMLAALWRAAALARSSGGAEPTVVSAQRAGAKRARPNDEADRS